MLEDTSICIEVFVYSVPKVSRLVLVLARDFSARYGNMAELLLDPDIRVWVIVPIVIISLLVGIIRHYVMVLLHREKNVTLTQMKDSQALLRSLRLRKNGGFLPQPVERHTIEHRSAHDFVLLDS
jgi:hypothetical protein